MIRGFTDSFMKVTSRNSFTFFRPFFLKLVLLPGVRSCPKNVQNMAPGHFSMRKKRNLQFWQNRARNCKSCELFKFGSFSPIQPTIPLISIAELWSRKTLKRPMIWYIFERQMVRGPQKQCSRVSDIQIHKYTNTVWVKFEDRPIYFWKVNVTRTSKT